MEKYNINLDENRKEEFLKLLAENGFANIELEEDKSNMTMMTDLYELTMSQVNFTHHEENDIEYFDGFFRKEPLDAGYGIVCGTDSMIDYIQNLHFTQSDIDYLRSTNKFTEGFLDYLKNFKFKGDIWAMPDGTPVFRNEPFITVRGNKIESKIVETALLSIYNSQIAYATAARKIVEAANGIEVVVEDEKTHELIPIMEFGARRAYGPQAAIDASKCAVIAGCAGTSNVKAAQMYGLTPMGTMAHSAIMEANSEEEAFEKYAITFPNKPLFLVDTYDTLKSGIPNAIKVCKKLGIQLGGIRIDSGDLAYLSKEAKKLLKEEFPDAVICLSNGLNAQTIASLKNQGAVIGSIGCGDNIASPDKRVGAVYKNSAIEQDGKIIPKIKVSGDTIKTTNPGFKKIWRFYDKETGYALGDVIAKHDEVIPLDKYVLVNHEDPLQTKELRNYNVKELQVPIFKNGELIYQDPSIAEKKIYCEKQMHTLYPEVRRVEKPHKYIVDLTNELLALKRELINVHREQIEGKAKVKVYHA